MGHHFVPVDRSTPFLLPPSLQEWLPDGHLARFVVEIVDQLDLTPLTKDYTGRGSKAYHPSMLLALLFYGYATGVFSSRKLEAATYDSIAFRFICANTHPDHDTIATFRRRFLSELEQYFLAILVIASEMNVLRLGTVALDGSKMKANASKHKALSYGHASRLEETLEKEVKELLAMAERTDRAEDKAQIDIPEEIKRREDRLKAIRAAKARIEERTEARHKTEQADYEAKVEKRRAKEQATGKKARGKEPKPPEAGPRDRDQVNLTDPESRIMPQSGGGFEQAYNVQAAVDLETHMVVAQFTTQAPNDKEQVEPALARLNALPEELGRVETMLTDNGFFSAENVERVVESGISPLMALAREAHHIPLGERMAVPTAPGAGGSALEEMAYRLKTEKGRALYGKRKSTVEPVFGQIKRVMGFRQFMMRGFARICGEWTLVTIAYNIRRLFELNKARQRSVGGSFLEATNGSGIITNLQNGRSVCHRSSHRLSFTNRLRPQFG